MKKENRVSWVIPALLIVSLANGVLGLDSNDAAVRGKPITERIADRDFPSVFQAWGRVQNLRDVSILEGIAKHDLMWSAISRAGSSHSWPVRSMLRCCPRR